MMRAAPLILANTLAHGLNIAMALGFTLVGARLMPVADYGELRYVMTLLPLFMALTLPGYDTAILRAASLRRYVPLAVVFRARFLGALLASAVGALLLLVVHDRVSAALIFLAAAALVLLPGFETGTGWRNYLMGLQRQRLALKLLLRARLAGLLLFGVGVGAIIIWRLDPLLLLPLYLLAMIVPTQAAFWTVVRHQRRAVVPSGRGWDLRVAVAITASGLIYTLAFSLDKLLVRHALGAEALALYAILLMVPQELARLFDATVPLFYRRLFLDNQVAALRTRLVALGALAAVVAGYGAAFYLLSDFIFGAAYRYDAVTVATAALVILSQSYEYWQTHKLFARLGARASFHYAALNLLLTTGLLPLGLAAGGVEGVIVALITKQLLTPRLLQAIYRWTGHAL